jgi:hypothetical protein
MNENCVEAIILARHLAARRVPHCACEPRKNEKRPTGKHGEVAEITPLVQVADRSAEVETWVADSHVTITVCPDTTLVPGAGEYVPNCFVPITQPAAAAVVDCNC